MAVTRSAVAVEAVNMDLRREIVSARVKGA
jgi:hypothetical protein